MDHEMRELERSVRADPTIEGLVRLWRAQARAGAADNPDNLTVAAPGSVQSDSFTGNTYTVEYERAPGAACAADVPITVRHVFWTGSASSDWEYGYRWTLGLAADGRFFALTTGYSGTCSMCGRDVYSVAVGDDLATLIDVGLGDQARSLMLRRTGAEILPASDREDE